MCGYLLRILVYWYGTQTMCVCWGNHISNEFQVCNGVRQGGILSLRLFAIYIDDLSGHSMGSRTLCQTIYRTGTPG